MKPCSWYSIVNTWQK